MPVSVPRDAAAAGDVPFSEPLHRVEDLIDANVLQPDVLMAADSEFGEMGAEHYPYDD